MSDALLAGAVALVLTAALAAALGRRLDVRSSRWVLVVAQLSALLAALADVRPTPLTAVNLVLAAALGLVVALAASRCPPWLCFGAAAGALALALGGPEPSAVGSACAAAALGVSVAVVASGARAPVVRAVVGLLLVQATLRLGWPEFTGGPSLAAAAVVGPVLVVGWVRAGRRPRRVAVAVLGGGAATAVVLSALAAVAALGGVDDVRIGVEATQAGVDAAASGDRERAIAELARAETALGRARTRVASPLTAPALAVPVVGHYVAAGRSLVVSGEELAAAAGTATRAADPARFRLQGATIDLDALTELRGPLVRATGALVRARARIVDVRSPWLTSALTGELDEADTRLAHAQRSVTTAAAAAERGPELLGASRPRRYFLALLTPSELRGTIGILGNYGVVVADRGRLSLEVVGRNADLNAALENTALEAGGTPTLDAPEDWLARYARYQPDRLWQNTTYSPDFPTTARVMAGLFPHSGGSPVDGVMALDPFALQAILAVTGPVTVEGWEEPLSADNALDVLLFEQYVELPDRPERAAFLGVAARRIWDALVQSDPDPRRLGEVLGPAVARGHVRMWTGDPRDAPLLDGLGLTSAFPDGRGGDSVGVVAVNAGGNKIDWFLRRTADLAVELDPATGRVATTVTATFRNDAPATGLPIDVIGSPGRDPALDGANLLTVSLYHSHQLRRLTVDGTEVLPEVARELGLNVYQTNLVIPAGASATVVAEFEGVSPLRAGRYRLGVLRQVGVRPETVTASVVTVDGRVLVARAPLADDADEVVAELGPAPRR